MPLQRVEEYVLADGGRSKNRAAATISPIRHVIAYALKYSDRIPPQFFVGTAQHESNFATNEIDTEVSGFTSYGIYQLSKDEAKEAGSPGANLLDLEEATRVFAFIQHRRLDALLKLAPKAIEPDIWCYLALAHNEGPGAAAKTINLYKLDWFGKGGYAERNAKSKILAYAKDCVSGGLAWKQFMDEIGL